MKFDEILEFHVGEFGPYQKRIYFLVCLPAIAAAFMSFVPVFIVATPKHRCRIPDLANDTYEIQSSYHEQLINSSIPMETDYYGDPRLSECKLYDHSNSSVMQSYVNMSTVECDEWVFDDSMFITAITDFKMVCGRAILQSHFKMITFFGALLGAIVNGLLADIFGRKKIFLISLGIYLVWTIGMLFAPAFEMFLAMRFLQGLSGIGVFMVSFVYVVELVGPHSRMFAGIFIEIFWCVGLFLLVAAAYFIRNWIHLILVLCSPCLLFFSYIWLIPESPRWLMSRGRLKEAEKILQRTAKANKTTLPENLLEEAMKEEAKDQEKRKETGKVWKLFTHRVLLIRTLVIVFNRFALNMAYYGIGLNVEHLSGNLYFNFTLSSVVETLAAVATLLLIRCFGRKPLYTGSMVIGALGFLAATLPIFLGGESEEIYAIGLVMFGKFGITAAYNVMYVYGSEVFPTSLRNSAMGISLFVELIGGAICPYVVDVSSAIGGKLGTAFPMIVFGAVSLSAGLISLVLPETRNKEMPETIQDAIRFGRNEIV